MIKINFFKVSQSLIRSIPMSLVSHSFFTAIGCSPIFLTMLTIIGVTHFIVDLLRCLAQ